MAEPGLYVVLRRMLPHPIDDEHHGAGVLLRSPTERRAFWFYARVVSRMMANCDGNQIHLKAYGNHMYVRPSSVPCVFGLHASKCLFMWLPLTDRKAKTARCSTGRTWSRAPKNRFQLVCYAIESLWMALLRLIASPPVNHMRHHR